MSQHRQNYIFRDIKYFVKMTVSTLLNFGYVLAQNEYQNQISHVISQILGSNQNQSRNK